MSKRPRGSGRGKPVRRRASPRAKRGTHGGATQLPEFGVLGGSGLYDMEGLSGIRKVRLRTPFGDPSAPYVVGSLGGRRVAFLARHGRGHRLLPSEVNYRANIWGFRMLGVRRLISASAVGSMREGIAPMDIVLPDQFIDRTQGRPRTFFGDGVVAHVSFADPFCPALRAAAVTAGRALPVRVHPAGTYIAIEGPQFSTRAESRLYRGWDVDVIGMTNLPEAYLAREAGVCYVTLALVTDYDCWHESEEVVSVDAVLGTLRRNAENARSLVRGLVEGAAGIGPCGCADALRGAVITAPDAIPPSVRRRLRLLLDPVLGG